MISLKSVVYFTTDVESVAKWVESLLNIQPFRSDENFTGFYIGNQELCIHKVDAKIADSWGNQICYWEVENLEGMIEKILTLGGSIHRSPLELPEGGKVCQLKSPFNFLIGLKESV